MWEFAKRRSRQHIEEGERLITTEEKQINLSFWHALSELSKNRKGKGEGAEDEELATEEPEEDGNAYMESLRFLLLLFC